MVWLNISCGVLSATILGVMVFIVILLRRGGDQGERGFPPGPPAWPVIGHLPHLLNPSSIPLHQSLRELSRTYGHIVGLRLGRQATVVVSSPDLAKQILLTHDQILADRPPLCFASTLFFPNDIIFGRRNPTWRTHRKLCMVHLFTAKRFQELQHVRHQEIAILLQRLHDHATAAATPGPVDLGHCIGQMSCALVLRLLHSRATYNSAPAAAENLPELFKEIEQMCAATLGELIPWLSFLDFAPKYRMGSLHTRIDKVLTAILTERKESDAHHDDLLRALLSSPETVTSSDIKAVMMDMLGAGIHTTALTLEWAMAELLRNPRCFYRLQRDIDETLGGQKQVTDADLPNLQYLKCVVKEVFRLHPVVPLLIPRISSEECKLHGYTIPANTLVYVNVWAIGRDEEVWARANEFIPERFEGKETDVKGQHFELLPFGSGRRSCLGLPLALSVVEVTLANLVKSFNWELPFGGTPESVNMDEKKGITVNRAYPVLAIPKPR